ncbi:carboxypeptidase regulatory-like domain-containing protein [Compostimonas suwonensis]|uniref:alpha-amylase n=1 Tax=Compostimonas suwonensis TaxID=1048394 RepID=A0A2M9C556_9MICO|nr:carboxypeptidase regulatory-like domain-containing protein [Compostimonas suwonensis]PJJ65646.1 carboxypeptidase family protein [Compostimonas suwonensis]
MPRLLFAGVLTAALALSPLAAQAANPQPTDPASSTSTPATESTATETPTSTAVPTEASTADPTPAPGETPAPSETPAPGELPAPPPPPQPTTGAPAPGEQTGTGTPTEQNGLTAPAPAPGSAQRAAVGPHSISGTVTRAGGAPVTAADSVWVSLIDQSSSSLIASTTTAIDGSYTLSDIPSGDDMVVQFGSGSGTLLGEYYDDAPSAFFAQAFTFTDEEPQTLTGIDAELALGSVISGHVSGSDGSSVDGVYVNIQRVPSGSGNSFFGGQVEADGDYSITGVAPGDYRVTFSGTPGGLMGQYYDGVYDQGSATLVTVAGNGQTVTGIDAILDPGSSVSGTVTRNDGGSFETSPVTVSVQPVDNQGFSVDATVAADGSYTVDGLAPGVYTVQFRPQEEGSNLILGYYGGTDWSTAARITIGAGEAQDLVGYDFGMLLGNEISGQITRADGEPWEEFRTPQVIVEEWDGSSTSVTSTSMEADGSYAVHGIAPGSYRVKFEGSYSDDAFGFVWYDDVIDPSAAHQFVFGSDPQVVTGIDGQLSQASSVSGTVTRSDGKPIEENTFVSLELPGSGYIAASTQVRADGSYRFDKVTPRDYVVRFGGTDHVREQYYPDVQYSYEATILTVTEEPLTGIDATLTAGAPVTGTVTRSDGAPIDYTSIAVYAYDADYRQAGSTWVNTDGSYKIPALAAGNYRFQFTPLGTGNPVVPSWWDGKASFEQADAVTMPSTLEAVTGIDTELIVGTTASGHVVDPNGDPVANTSVSFAGADGRYGYGTTNADGDYTVYGLADGDYTVQFSTWDTGLIGEYYDDARTVDDATLVTVENAEPVTGIDAALEQGSTISGTVTRADGGSLADCAVRVSLVRDAPPSQSGDGGECVDADGGYAIDGIAPDRYFVAFGGEGLATQWFDDVSVRADATVLEFVEGEPRDETGVDAELQPGGSITASATRSDGGSLDAVTVEAVLADGGTVVYSRAVGSYEPQFTLSGLPLDRYLLRFSAPGLPTQYYGGADAGSATVVDLTTEPDATGIAVALAAASTAALEVTRGGGETVTAGQTLAALAVTVVDGAGEPVYGKRVVFTVSGAATFAGGATTATAPSNSAGLAVSPALLSGETAGTVTASARISGVSGSSVAFDPSTVRDAQDGAGDLSVTTTATTSLENGLAVLTVTVLNSGPAAADLRITTPFGAKTYTNVAPGAEATRVFRSYRASVDDGTVTVRVTDPVGGHSIDISTDYEGVEL